MINQFKIVVLISGSGSNLQAIMDNIDNGYLEGVEIVKVISNNCNAYGLKRAESRGIKNACISSKEYTDKEYCEKMLEELEDSKPNLIVLAGYMSILEEIIIEKYRNRIINIHPSLIPKYCGKGFYGKRVHQAVLDNKEEISGATVHYVDEGVDTGDIIIRRKVAVMEGDTVETLAARVLSVEHQILSEAIKGIFKERSRGGDK